MPRKLLAYWVTQLTGWGVYISLLALNYMLSRELDTGIVLVLLCLFLTGIALSHVYRLIIIRGRWLTYSLFKAVIPVLISSVILGLLMGLAQLTYFKLFISSDIFYKLRFENALSVWLQWLAIFMIWSIIYFAFHFFEKSRKEEIKNLRLEAMRTEVELNNLKSQLNPHFMFNSMNSIRALIDENPELAKESVTKLSNILRNTLMMGRKKLVTVEEELGIIFDYLKLETIRYEERLQAEFDLDDECMKALIPPLMMQTLVENAIKHGISRLPGGGIISIMVKKKSKKLAIRITNSGMLDRSKTPETGIGIQNTRQRLELIYENNADFRIFEEKGKVIAEISLPFSVSAGTINVL